MTVKRGMRWLSICSTLALMPGSAGAVTIDDFRVETAAQLADLCRAVPRDNDTLAAAQFCQGFMTGAYHYHVASQAGPAGKQVVCFQGEEPSRGKAAAEFVNWLDTHPQYASENAVEAQLKWMTDTWPCKN
ncbi:MAG TPA: Rap1a/Tai family immunity protein [Dongiaceae bacterium]|nr:Rap1a/Tai family immunity protein [Dongiaceae bacterium]